MFLITHKVWGCKLILPVGHSFGSLDFCTCNAAWPTWKSSIVIFINYIDWLQFQFCGYPIHLWTDKIKGAKWRGTHMPCTTSTIQEFLVVHNLPDDEIMYRTYHINLILLYSQLFNKISNQQLINRRQIQQ